MSQVTTAFDLFIARLRTLFPQASGYFQITNPYDMSDNQVQFLRQGFGIAIGPGTNTNRAQCGVVTVAREYRVVLSRSLNALEFDVDAKDASVKLLLEDAQSVIESFEREFRLNDDSFNTAFISDSGIQPLSIENFSILYIELTFTVELFDNP